MKFSNTLIIALAVLFFGCKDGYIDDISSVDPGPDEAAPVVTINNPPSSVVIPFTDESTDIEFDVSVEDDIELVSFTLSLNGTELATFSDFVDYRNGSGTYLSESIPLGTHTFTVVAEDINGKTTTADREFVVTNSYIAMANEIFYMPFEGDVATELITETNAETFGTSFAAGVFGRAMDFDGPNSTYALFPGEVMDTLSSFTVSFWTKAEFVDENEDGGIDGMQGLIGLSNTTRFWGNWHVFLENGSGPTDGGDFRIHTQNGANSPTYSESWINPDNVTSMFDGWANHVVSYDDASKEFKYYLNGALVNTTTAAWSEELVFASSGQMVFGCAQFMTDPSLTSGATAQSWAGYYNGRLDEIRIFNVALTETAISDLYDMVAN